MSSISHVEAENSSAKSLFNCPPPPGGEVNLVATENGPMLIRKSDSIIGATLAAHGRFEEDTLVDVTSFLRLNHGFTPSNLSISGPISELLFCGPLGAVTLRLEWR